ncbi:MAG: hypothetical protein GC202_01265 [Alphaproteobacteria bacterium]|nr:hypothetical protein [Alphaproteobacteria bacterium]
MGGLSIPAMMAIQTGVGLVQGIASSSAAASQAEAQANAQRQAMQAAADRQRQALDQQYASETRKRQNLLERATARANVSFGARGVSPSEGSAGALLRGIEDGFYADEADRAGSYALQREGLDAGLADSLRQLDYAGQRNLLARDDDIQRRILGLLSWGGAMAGRGGGRAPTGGMSANLPDVISI